MVFLHQTGDSTVHMCNLVQHHLPERLHAEVTEPKHKSSADPAGWNQTCDFPPAGLMDKASTSTQCLEDTQHQYVFLHIRKWVEILHVKCNNSQYYKHSYSAKFFSPNSSIHTGKEKSYLSVSVLFSHDSYHQRGLNPRGSAGGRWMGVCRAIQQSVIMYKWSNGDIRLAGCLGLPPRVSAKLWSSEREVEVTHFWFFQHTVVYYIQLGKWLQVLARGLRIL